MKKLMTNVFIVFGLVMLVFSAYNLGKIVNNTEVEVRYETIARMTHQYNCQRIVDYAFQNKNTLMSKEQMFLSLKCNQEANVVGSLVKLNFDKIQTEDYPLVLDKILSQPAAEFKESNRNPANLESNKRPKSPSFPEDFGKNLKPKEVGNFI